MNEYKDFCHCGQSRYKHWGVRGKCVTANHEQNCSCDNFQLDNLSYVEQVARAKGLV